MVIKIAGIAHGSSGLVGDGLALSLPFFPRSSALFLGSEARAAVPSPFELELAAAAIFLQGD